MRAVDTNVVVRLLKNDDATQAVKARSLLDSEPVFVSTTVILETEWVLRAGYGYARAEVSNAIKRLAGHRHVTLEDTGRVARALAFMDEGLDFADALHLAGASACETFLTFDRDLAKQAARIDSKLVRLL